MRDYKKQDLYPNTNVLSGSMILDYARSPQDFHFKWLLGIEGYRSPALIFGIVFSDAYADRDWDYLTYCKENGVAPRLIAVLQKVLPLFPVLPKKFCEYELFVKLGKWKVRVTLDGLLPKQDTIVENKTGQMVWNQTVCDYHPQLTLQQWAFWKKFGKLPKDHILNWVDTSTQATKPIHTFHVKRTIGQLKEFEQKLIEIIKGVEVGNFTVRRQYW